MGWSFIVTECRLVRALFVSLVLVAGCDAQTPSSGSPDTSVWGQGHPPGRPLTSLQPEVAPPAANTNTNTNSSQAPANPPGPSSALRLDYVLGPDDAVTVRAFDMEDQIAEGPYLVQSDGSIALPVLGKFKAGGITVQKLENDVAENMRKYVRQPHAQVSIVKFRSEPIFVEGEFRAPGIYQLQDQKSLLELITRIGLQPDASHRVKITRRLEYGEIPVANVSVANGAKVSSADIDVTKLREGTSLDGDIELKPYDVISATRADMIYVLGEVGRNGTLDVGDRESISVLQAVTMSGGLTREAHPNKAYVLRSGADENHRTEIPVDIKKILNAKAEDFSLRPNDILFVPGVNQKLEMAEKSIMTALPLIPTFAYLFLR